MPVFSKAKSWLFGACWWEWRLGSHYIYCFIKCKLAYAFQTYHLIMLNSDLFVTLMEFLQLIFLCNKKENLFIYLFFSFGFFQNLYEFVHVFWPSLSSCYLLVFFITLFFVSMTTHITFMLNFLFILWGNNIWVFMVCIILQLVDILEFIPTHVAVCSP